MQIFAWYAFEVRCLLECTIDRFSYGASEDPGVAARLVVYGLFLIEDPGVWPQDRNDCLHMVHSPLDFGVCFIDSIWAPSFCWNLKWQLGFMWIFLFMKNCLSCCYSSLLVYKACSAVLRLIFQPFPFNKLYIIPSFWWLLQKWLRCLNQEGEQALIYNLKAVFRGEKHL